MHVIRNASQFSATQGSQVFATQRKKPFFSMEKTAPAKIVFAGKNTFYRQKPAKILAKILFAGRNTRKKYTVCRQKYF